MNSRKKIRFLKYKKNLVYPISEAYNTWGTLRHPSIKRGEYARAHDYLTLIRTTLIPLKGTTLRWLLVPEFPTPGLS